MAWVEEQTPTSFPVPSTDSQRCWECTLRSNETVRFLIWFWSKHLVINHSLWGCNEGWLGMQTFYSFLVQSSRNHQWDTFTPVEKLNPGLERGWRNICWVPEAELQPRTRDDGYKNLDNTRYLTGPGLCLPKEADWPPAFPSPSAGKVLSDATRAVFPEYGHNISAMTLLILWGLHCRAIGQCQRVYRYMRGCRPPISSGWKRREELFKRSSISPTIFSREKSQSNWKSRCEDPPPPHLYDLGCRKKELFLSNS